MDDSPRTDRRFATTLARGLSVLRAFRPTDDGLGNADISERTGLPKSTVSRLTFTLQALGYLDHANRRDKYRPGPALLALGNVASASISFMDMADPLMQELADGTGTLGVLLVRHDNKMLIVKTWRPRGKASLWLDVGHRLPLNGSSSGHALLASLSEEGFARTVADAVGERGLTPERAMEIRHHAHDQLTTRGFVMAGSDEYFTPNIRAVSVPYYARDLSEPVIFTCGALPGEFPEERAQAEVGPGLRTMVEELERITGHGVSKGVREL